jgi:hypothetical protein
MHRLDNGKNRSASVTNNNNHKPTQLLSVTLQKDVSKLPALKIVTSAGCWPNSSLRRGFHRRRELALRFCKLPASAPFLRLRQFLPVAKFHYHRICIAFATIFPKGNRTHREAWRNCANFRIDGRGSTLAGLTVAQWRWFFGSGWGERHILVDTLGLLLHAVVRPADSRTRARCIGSV